MLEKSFPKKFFCKVVQLYFEISLLSFIHKIFEQNFYPYITVYFVRIWTYKNADEKAHTFSRRSKNVKKRTKTYEKRILCKFTLSNVQKKANIYQYYDANGIKLSFSPPRNFHNVSKQKLKCNATFAIAEVAL